MNGFSILSGIQTRIKIPVTAFLLAAGLLACHRPAFPQTARDSLFVDKIAFDSDRDGVRQIYIMNTDGTGLKKITTGPAENMCPSLSSDGRKIVFESKRDGNYEVYIMNSDGTNQKRLTNTPEDEYSQEFSPDGSKIYFIRYFNTRSEIWVMNPDGTNPLRLTNNQAHDERPRLSPDGKTILFMSDRSSQYEVWLMDPDGSNQRKFGNLTGMNVFAAWSPDGSRIVYSHYTGNAPALGNLYLINSDGTGNTPLTNGAGVSEDPCWSPDGRKIVFQTSRDGNFEIYTINADGTGEKRLTSSPTWDGWPCWGRIRYPINKYLGQSPPRNTIRRFPPDNLQMLSVLNTWMWHGSPSFSPDYQEMFFVKYLIPTDKAEIWQTQLVDNKWILPEPASFGNRSVIENAPVFSPSGDTLYFYSQRSGTGGFYQCFRQSGGSWSEPVQISLELPDGTSTGWNLCISNNRTLYFELYYALTNTDIFKSEWKDGKYGPPVKLPGTINGDFGENCAFIDPNEEYMLFISNRAGGSGLHDIYVSYHNRDGSWTQAFNPGSWLNSAQEDGFPLVSPDGKYLFFNTARAGDLGYNPYWVSTAFIDKLRPLEPDTTTRVVFTSDREGNSEIYTMYSDGTDVKRLTDNIYTDIHPCYSNDGREIVFTSDRGGDFDLYRMKADGTGVTKLTATSLQASYPDWSPDGSLIVFMLSDDIDPDEGEIALINVDGSGFRVLSGAGTGSRPVWSDDGSSILLSSRRSGSAEIYLMDPDGNNIRQITHSGSNKRFARLSPDGENIVFTEISPSGADAQIHVINADGTVDKVLTDKGNLNTLPCWSSDGKYIFFESARLGNSEIYRMDADGTNQVNLTRDESENSTPNSIRRVKTSGMPEIADKSVASGLKIYPVPTDGTLTVEINLTQPGHADLSVMDTLGRMIRQVARFDLVQGDLTCQIELGDLSPGLYALVLSSGEGMKVERFLKK